jgi:hypothetical protein
MRNYRFEELVLVERVASMEGARSDGETPGGRVGRAQAKVVNRFDSSAWVDGIRTS